MWFSSWSEKWQRALRTGHSHAGRRRRLPSQRPVAALESLEDRVVLSAFTAATAAALVADINAANKAGGANTITLTAPTSSPYVLSAVDNTSDGPTMLPVIANGDSLTIMGWGTIDGSKLGRQFDIASGASLTLENLTLQNGLASSQGGAAQGGAILNQGNLVLNDVTLLHNSAVASAANEIAAGGAIWSDGSLTVENSSNFAFEGNSALSLSNAYGGAIDIAGGTADIMDSYFGQNNAQSTQAQSYGGALYVAAGTVTISGDTVGKAPQYAGAQGNSAKGSSPHGGTYGGGLCVAGGDVVLTHDTIVNNNAYYGLGGGIYIASAADVSLDAFTQAQAQYNTPSNIYGTYHRV